MSRFKKYMVFLSIIFVTLITKHGIAQISYNDTTCIYNLDANIEAILSTNPDKYTSVEVDKLIELAACFNNLYLPTVTIKLLTGNQFKPNTETVSEKQVIAIYLELASAYQQVKNYEKAESSYKKAINILSSKNNHKQTLLALIKLEELLLEEGKAEKAALYITPIRKLSEGQHRDNNLWCKELLFEAEVMKLKQNYAGAIKKHQQAIGSPKQCDHTLRAQHILELAALYTAVNKFDSSQLSLNSLGKDSLLLLSDYYLTKSGLLRERKRLKDAAYYFKKYVDEEEKINDYLIKNREKSLSENSAFLQLISAIQPIEKINKFNLGVSIIAILIALIILTVLILIILSQRKQLLKRRTELKKVEDTKEMAINDGKLMVEKNDEIQKRLDSIENEIENKIEAINELEKQIRLTKEEKKKRDKIYLDLNFRIRTLLSSILGLSSIFKTEFAKMREKELYENADIIEENASRIMNTIEAYYEYTSIDSGKVSVDLKQVNAVNIIQQVVDELLPIAKQKAVKLVFNKKRIPMVMASPKILRKIVTIATNVALKNTIKGFVTIDIELTKKNKFCEIKVQNTGHGFDKAYVKDILEPFNREGLNYIPGFNGTGMEYPLINKLAKLIKGEVAIDAEIEQGITFTLTVQATGVFDDEAQVKSPLKKKKTSVPWEGLKVFVVEDDKLNRLFFTKILKEAATLVISKDGEEAMETIGNLFRNGEIFDIILMDINLPEPWNGVKLKNRIQELFLPYRSIPFIAQTAYAMQGDREKFLSEGFDEYISKPIIKNKLIKVVAKVLKTT